MTHHCKESSLDKKRKSAELDAGSPNANNFSRYKLRMSTSTGRLTGMYVNKSLLFEEHLTLLAVNLRDLAVGISFVLFDQLVSRHLGSGCGSAISCFSYNCSFGGQEESNTGQDPLFLIGVLTLHSDIEDGYQVSSTSVGGEVHGAVVTSVGGSEVLADRSNKNYGHFGRKLFQYHLIEVSLLTVTAIFPASSFERESIYVSTSLWELSNVSGVETVGDIGSQVHLVKRLVRSTSSDLHDGGQERHGVKKSRNPKYIGGNELFRPALKLCASQDKIFEPDEETLLGEIGNGLPAWRNSVHGKGPGELSHSFSDV